MNSAVFDAVWIGRHTREYRSRRSTPHDPSGASIAMVGLLAGLMPAVIVSGGPAIREP